MKLKYETFYQQNFAAHQLIMKLIMKTNTYTHINCCKEKECRCWGDDGGSETNRKLTFIAELNFATR